MSDLIQPKTPLYCGVCGFPPEYCLYGSRLSKCKTWLNSNHPQLFTQIYGSSSTAEVSDALNKASLEDAPDGKAATASAGAGGDKLDEEARKKEAKAMAKEEKAAKKKSEQKVLIKREQRNKRKYVTAIGNLDAFGVDLKKAAKLFSNKFATGASVTKNNQGVDEIVIQGDVAYDVEELLQDKTPKIADILGGGKIPEDNVEVIEDKKK